MKISLRQIEIFLSVAKTLNVSQSAQELLLSQSAVSMSLAELERLLRGNLFDRSAKRIFLNDRGKLLLPMAKEVYDRMQEIESLLSLKSTQGRINNKIPLKGKLKITASTTIGNYQIPSLMGAFVAHHPEVKLSLDVKNSADVLQSVLQFETDAGLVEGLVQEPQVDMTVWKEDHLIVIASPSHPLAHKNNIQLEDLENSGWIMREPGSGTREIFENALLGKINKLNLLLELGNTEAVKSAVESSQALSCLSHVTVAKDLDQGRLIKIKTPFLNLKRNFYLVLHKEKYRTNLLQSFLDFIYT